LQDPESGEVTASRLPGGYKLDVHNWLEGYPVPGNDQDFVEVRFKNTRKAFYVNVNRIPLNKGDIVAVESSPGHDIGIVSLTGELARRKLLKGSNREAPGELRKLYRKAKQGDVDKWYSALELEQPTMLRARQISQSLKLEMKITDVEYQGDKTKAIFYYISDSRVDFRELIKLYADEFKIRIEMKQIGARQEAGRIGGIGSCGRELCCSTWMSHFVSVSTSAARYQEVSLNPQKLAGQCGKLKCCLNYELKCYLEAQQNFPPTSLPLQTEQGDAYHRKTDVFRRVMWYSFEKESEAAVLIPLDVAKVEEIIEMNKKGIKVKQLDAMAQPAETEPEIGYQNAVGEDSISRFEEQRKKKKKQGRFDSSRGGNRPKNPNRNPGVQTQGGNTQGGNRSGGNKPDGGRPGNNRSGGPGNPAHNPRRFDSRNPGRSQGRPGQPGRPGQQGPPDKKE